MKTLKEIKRYLKEQETETVESKRGSIYKIIRVDEKLIDRVFEFKSLYKSVQFVNHEFIYPIVWFEKGKRNEVIIAKK